MLLPRQIGWVCVQSRATPHDAPKLQASRVQHGIAAVSYVNPKVPTSPTNKSTNPETANISRPSVPTHAVYLTVFQAASAPSAADWGRPASTRMPSASSPIHYFKESHRTDSTTLKTFKDKDARTKGSHRTSTRNERHQTMTMDGPNPGPRGQPDLSELRAPATARPAE